MNHSKFDDKAKQIFKEMDNQDFSEALARKPEIWNALDINKNRPAPYRWLLWFLLGFSLAVLFGIFLKDKIIKTTIQPSESFADAQPKNGFQNQLKNMETQMNELKYQFDEKNEKIDSLQLINRELQKRLEIYENEGGILSASESEILTIRDTLYITELKIENIFQEKIIRDTVFIQVPITEQEQELMAEVSDEVKQSDIPLNQTKKEVEKRRPTSVQYNFSEVNRN